MEIKTRFDAESNGASGALQAYQELNERKKELRAQKQEIPAELKAEISAAIKAVYKYAELVLITPNDASHQSIRDALVTDAKRDKVHPLETMDELVNYRLGNENDNKRAYGLIIDIPGQDPEILSVIYTHWSKQGHNAANLDEQKLPGNVADILIEEVQPLNEQADTGIFYSISSFFPGAGVELIKSLRSELGGDQNAAEMDGSTPALSTLSPFRSFGNWVAEQGEDVPEAPELRQEFLEAAALRYLDEVSDPVQKFHMGNGAYIGKINIDSNTPESQDGAEGLGLLINYVYPAGDDLATNQAAFKQGSITKARKLKM